VTWDDLARAAFGVPEKWSLSLADKKALAGVLRAVAARCDELATFAVEQKSWTLEYRAGFHAAVDELAAELRRIAAEGTQA